MTPVKDEMLMKELTAAEVRALVDEWVANGGVITQCAPGVALNFRSRLGDEEPPKLRRPAITRTRAKTPKPTKKTKKKVQKNKTRK